MGSSPAGPARMRSWNSSARDVDPVPHDAIAVHENERTTWIPCARMISSGRSFALSVRIVIGRRTDSCAAGPAGGFVLGPHVLGFVPLRAARCPFK